MKLGVLRVLVVGGGSIGERHARCFLSTGRCEVAVCEPRPERRQELADRYPLSATFSDPDAALSLTWDAAVIATPAPFHVSQARRFVERGTAVLIEKPLSTTLDGVWELTEAAGRAGVPVGVAYVFRAHPAVAELKRRLQAGEIGPLRLVTVTSGQNFPTFRPDYREIYYAHRESGGGVIQDALTHMVDLVRYLAGPFDWVFADASCQALTGVEVEDTANLTARLDGGQVLATLTGNQFQMPNETRLECHGAAGSLRLELPSHRWSILRAGDTAWSVSEPMVHERDELFVRQAQAFLDAVEGRAELLCPLAEAEHVLRVNLAALQSAAEGRVIPLEAAG